MVIHKYDGNGFSEERFNRNVELFNSNVKSIQSKVVTIDDPVSRGGNNWELCRNEGSLYCERFNNNVLLPNGDVYLCCSDWGLKHKIGNLYENSYDSNEFVAAREKIMRLAITKNSDVLCRTCEWARQKDNIALDLLHVYMLCYNEERLLPHVLDYWSQYADKIIIYDNMSTDSSLDIIRKYPKTEIRTFDTDGKISDRTYLEIKNNAWKESRGKARFVALVDTDELVYHPKGLDVFLTIAYLRGYTIISPLNVYSVLSTVNNGFDPAIDLSISDDNNQLAFLDSAVVHGFKINIFSPILSEINYLPGAHAANPVGYINILNDSIMVHYHYIVGVNQLIEKYKMNALRLSEDNKINGWASHYMYEQNLINVFNGEPKLKSSDVFKRFS